MNTKIHEMLKLQQKLNDATNGEGWEEGVNKNGKTINWFRAMWLEAAESLESFPWKHWKNIDADPDYENVKIETVDNWHFVMSQLLADAKVLGEEGMSNVDAVFSTIMKNEYALQLIGTATPIERSSVEDQMESIEIFAGAALQKDSQGVLDTFFQMCQDVGMDIDSLYSLYLGKNILNSFRQDNGYKDGSYIKTWGDVEDNVIMQGILDKNPSITAEELYASLDLNYHRLCLDIKSDMTEDISEGVSTPKP